MRDGNIERAILIAREALPRDMRNPDRPIWNGAFEVIAKARARDRVLAAMVGHEAQVNSAAFSPDGKRVVTASVDGTARVWDAASGCRARHPRRPHRAESTAPRSAPTASGSSQPLWTGRRGCGMPWAAPRSPPSEGHTGGIHSTAFSPDGKRIIIMPIHDIITDVTASWDDTARLWDGKPGPRSPPSKATRAGSNSFVFSPDSKRVLTTSDDRTARLWDAASGAALATLKGQDWSAAFSPDGKRVVTTSFDNTAYDHTARLWDAKTGVALASLEGHQDTVWTAVFSPHGARVVTASNDNTSRVWDGKTGAPLASLKGHTDGVRSAVFSPDGKRVITASKDNTARVWNAASGAVLATLEGNFRSAAFSPDGKRVVTGSLDGTARVWMSRATPRSSPSNFTLRAPRSTPTRA